VASRVVTLASRVVNLASRVVNLASRVVNLASRVVNLASRVVNLLSIVVFKPLIASKRRCPSLKVGTFGMRAISREAVSNSVEVVVNTSESCLKSG